MHNIPTHQMKENAYAIVQPTRVTRVAFGRDDEAVSSLLSDAQFPPEVWVNCVDVGMTFGGHSLVST